MGLFGREDKNPQSSPAISPTPPRPLQPSPGPHQATTTIVAGSTAIEGKLKGSNDLRIEGEVTGEVRGSGLLIIADGGRAKARLHARVVMVAGSVEGDVSADERIELQPSARLTGNITAPKVVIQEGATFDGQVFMKKGSGGQPDAKEHSSEPAAGPAAAKGAGEESEAEESGEGGGKLFDDERHGRSKNRR